MFHSAIRKLFGRGNRSVVRSVSPAKRPLHLEILEDRLVPSTTWYVNGSATGGNSGTSWTNAFKSLQSALTAAKSGDQIWVEAGTYRPTSGTDRTVSFALPNGVAVYGGFAGTEIQLSQRNIVRNPTILSGDIGSSGDNSDDSYNVVTTGSDGASTILDGFTITAGNANAPLNASDYGGGLYNNGGSPTLTNLIFNGNSAFDGGGLFSEGSPTLTNVTFSSNTTIQDGGGLYTNSGSPTLTNVTFTDNSASRGAGLFGVGSPRLTNVTFSGNSATSQGGGLFIYSGLPMLTNVTFSGNSASQGGGMLNEGLPTLTNCILWGDSSGEITSNAGGSAVVSYSDVQGGFSGTGNINADPQFVGAATGNLHLTAGSPCIDAGTNTGAQSFDLDNVPRPLVGGTGKGAITDMGVLRVPGHPVRQRRGHRQRQRLHLGQRLHRLAAGPGGGHRSSAGLGRSGHVQTNQRHRPHRFLQHSQRRGGLRRLRRL